MKVCMTFIWSEQQQASVRCWLDGIARDEINRAALEVSTRPSVNDCEKRRSTVNNLTASNST